MGLKTHKILFLCGIAAAVLYVCTDILAALLYEGYSYTAQTVSELIAIDAPTRPAVAALFIIFALLVFAFGAGIWMSPGKKLALRLAAIGLIGKELLGTVVTVFFPMHMRGTVITLTDTMHKNLTMAGLLFIMLAMFSGAAAFGKRFRIYSITTVIVFALFGMLSGSEIANMEANLPTKWLGIYERINIYGYMLWMSVLSIMLINRKQSS